MAELRVTVLVDNDHRTEEEKKKEAKRCLFPGDASPLACEWGLSLWLEYRDSQNALRKFLLDAGSEGGFAENAKALGIDLREAGCLVLSHAHYDHTDGADAFFAVNDTAPVCLSENAKGCRCYSRKKDGSLRYIGIREGLLSPVKSRLVYTKGLTQLTPGVYLVPHKKADTEAIARRQGLFVEAEGGMPVPDRFRHEQSLVVRTDAGLVILSPCSHTGMRAITEEVQETFPGEPLAAFVGGLHLFRLDEEETRREGEVIRSLPVKRIYTGHCTGERQTQILKEMLGEKLVPFASGSVFTI